VGASEGKSGASDAPLEHLKLASRRAVMTDLERMNSKMTVKGESERPANGKRGPKSAITRAVVKRVSTRVGRGLTLEWALAAEGKAKINVDTWKKALQKHKEFQPLYEAGRGQFLAWATKRLAESKDLGNLRWLMVRRFAKLFARLVANASINGINYKANYDRLVEVWTAFRHSNEEIQITDLDLKTNQEMDEAKGQSESMNTMDAVEGKADKLPKNGSRGPKSAITRAVVKRVSVLVGRGLTLEFALAAEAKAKINVETWKKALRKHKDFQPRYEAGQAKFLDWALKRLTESKDPANLRWVMELRYPDLFARPAAAGSSASAEAMEYKTKYEGLVALCREYMARDEARKTERELAQKAGAGQNGDSPATEPEPVGAETPAVAVGAAGTTPALSGSTAPVLRRKHDGGQTDQTGVNKVWAEVRRLEAVRRREGLAQAGYTVPGADC
jgi:hypothetical protein